MVPEAAAADTDPEEDSVGVDLLSLSFVPREFWRPPPPGPDPSTTPSRLPYSVLVAGDGLLCISNGIVNKFLGLRAVNPQLCVLNPLTRAWRMLDRVPYPPPPGERLWTTLAVHLHAGAFTVLAATTPVRGHEAAAQCAVLTYDLTAAAATAAAGASSGGWTVAQGPLRISDPETMRPFDHPRTSSDPARFGYFVACAGEVYCYCGSGNWFRSCSSSNRLVHVHAVSPAGDGGAAGGALVETAQVSAPGAFAYRDDDVFLVARRGQVFFMAVVADPDVPTSGTLENSCRVWVLARHCLEWQEVGALSRQELDRLTGFKYAHYSCMAVCNAFAAGDLVCFELHIAKAAVVGPPGSYDLSKWVQLMVGLNLVTSTWEVLVHGERWLYDTYALELRPNLFLD